MIDKYNIGAIKKLFVNDVFIGSTLKSKPVTLKIKEELIDVKPEWACQETTGVIKKSVKVTGEFSILYNQNLLSLLYEVLGRDIQKEVQVISGVNIEFRDKGIEIKNAKLEVELSLNFKNNKYSEINFKFEAFGTNKIKINKFVSVQTTKKYKL